MEDVLEPPRATASSPQRVDVILRWLVVAALVVALGIGGLLGYTVWQANNSEDSSTPAGRALMDLKNRVRANPGDADLRVRLGEAFATAGLYKDAVEQLQAATSINKSHSGAFLDLGIIAMQEKQPKTAEGYFNKVIDLTTGSEYEGINDRREQAYFYLGSIALDARRYEDAAANLKAALRIRRDASDTYYLLAQAYHGMDRDDAAVDQLNAALAFDPNYAEAHYLMGQIYLAKNDKINAAVHFRMAADAAPQQDLPQEALANLGDVGDIVAQGSTALKGGDVRSAIDKALLARAMDPKDTRAIKLHAEALVASDEPSAAVKAYKQLLKLNPKDAEAKSAIARLAPAK